MDSDAHRRANVAAALADFRNLQISQISSFPIRAADLDQILPDPYNIVLLNVDCDPALAFALTEQLNTNPQIYLMVYSSRVDMKLTVQLMRAGAREFFVFPIDAHEISSALARAAERYTIASQEARASSRLFVFLGTKGGCGVTTLAANFALALAQESEGNTLLVDFGLPLGDVAINLGITTEYSVRNALQYPDRLDHRLLSTLVAHHSSGLSVLASPSEFSDAAMPLDSIDRLVAVAAESYRFVVVDAGSRIDLLGTALFDKSAIIYLVTQVGITELFNANRMVSKFFFTRDQTLQIVLNRYKPSDLVFDEKKISEALTRPAQWKIPDDYAAARRTRETATPMVLIDSPISRALRDMAKSAAGLTIGKSDRKGLFRFLR